MVRIHRYWALGVLAVLLSAAAAGVGFAQESPPTRVGRLSYIGGSVSFEPAGTQEWATAQLNRPVTIGDRIWTDWDSRAEVEIGDAVVRLGSRTGFSFLNLNARTAQIQLTTGTAIVRVRRLARGERDEIDTPNLALSLEEPGTYQVHVGASGNVTKVEVIRGAAIASGGGQTFHITAQQRATFAGTTALNVAYGTLGLPDALDEWSMARDREEARAARVTKYVSPDMVGIYALDTYGSWQDTPAWGYAWFPNVVAGWAPYRFGHWVWIYPWGWTWVDDEPWGFAPFHYGRWAYWHSAWCWVPGPRDVQPVYAPALVAWTRGVRPAGPHGRSYPAPHRGPYPRHAHRGIGWAPLGPHDVYLPGYAANRAYVRAVNLTNSRALSATAVAAALRRGRVGLTYANRHVPGAITAVSRATFSASRAADTHRVVFTRRGLQKVRLTSAAPAITPSRLSVLGARTGAPTVPPRQLTNRPVVARLLPPRAAVSFVRQQAAVRANGGRPLTTRQWARFRPNRPVAAVRLAPDIRPAAPVYRRSPLRRGSAGRTPPVGSSVARMGRPQRLRAPPRYRADRPAWARSPSDARGRPIRHSPARSPQTTPWRAAPGGRGAQPRSSPRRSMPRPRYRVPRLRRAPGSPRRPANPGARRPIIGQLWHSAPPMYRAQHIAAPPRARPSFAIRNSYSLPRSPPPMYRPLVPHVAARSFAPPPSRPAFHPAPAPAARHWTPQRARRP